MKEKYLTKAQLKAKRQEEAIIASTMASEYKQAYEQQKARRSLYSSKKYRQLDLWTQWPQSFPEYKPEQ